MKLKFYFFTLVLALGFTCASAGERDRVEQGDVVYSFMKGQMQCLSEVDEEGNIYILIKNLKDNTNVEFSRLSSKAKAVITLSMVVEDNEICRSWKDIQEVHITIDPMPVKTTTLSGKVIHKTDRFTILKAS